MALPRGDGVRDRGGLHDCEMVKMELVTYFRLPHGHAPTLLAQAIEFSGAPPDARPVVIDTDADGVLYQVTVVRG